MTAKDFPSDQTILGTAFVQHPSLDIELLNTFRDEIKRHLGLMSQYIETGHGVQDRATLKAMKRSLHTLKGTVGTIGTDSFTLLLHQLEDVFDVAATQSPEDQQTINTATNQIMRLVEDFARDGQTTQLTERCERAQHELTELLARLPQSSADAVAEQANQSVEASSLDSQVNDRRKVGRSNRNTIVRLTRELGTLARHRSELQVNLSNVSAHLANLHQRMEQLIQTTVELERSKSPLRQLEQQDPDAATRSDLEIEQRMLVQLKRVSVDLSALYWNAMRDVEESESVAFTHQRRIRDIRHFVEQERAMSIDGFAARCRHITERIAAKQNKKVSCTHHHHGIELDNLLIDSLSDPILHLLRNAVDHGVEDPEVRIANGKDPVATIDLSLRLQPGVIVLDVSDDGKGIDPKVMRDVAVRKGLVSQVQADAQSDAEVMQYLLMAGFSTNAQITEYSGRGVGMDVVKQSVEELGGSISIDSKLGHGTRISLEFPIELASVELLVCRDRGHTFALAVPMIKSVTRLDSQNIWSHGKLRIGEEWLACIAIDEAYCPVEFRELPTQSAAIMINVGNETRALLVQQIVHRQSYPITPVAGCQEPGAPFLGAIIDDDGRASMVLNTLTWPKSNAE